MKPPKFERRWLASRLLEWKGAEWIAVDEHGDCCVFADKPQGHGGGSWWLDNGFLGSTRMIGVVDLNGQDWRETLMSRKQAEELVDG